MGKMSEKFIMSRLIIFISHYDEIEEEPPSMCVWSCTMYIGLDIPHFVSLSFCWVGGQFCRQEKYVKIAVCISK
jgi:hypothetical protein